MGFGWLFVGYFVANLMSMNMFGFAFRLLGYSLIFMAATKIRRYNTKFLYLNIGAAIMIFASLVYGAIFVCGNLYSEMLIPSSDLVTLLCSDKTESIFSTLDSIAGLVFHALMLYAIRDIANEVGVGKISISATRNFVFICIYKFLFFIGQLPFVFVADYVKAFALPVLVLEIVCIVLNLALIFSCYMYICDEADASMERKPSRFAFVNHMRAESERRRIEAEERREAAKREKNMKNGRR